MGLAARSIAASRDTRQTCGPARERLGGYRRPVPRDTNVAVRTLAVAGVGGTGKRLD